MVLMDYYLIFKYPRRDLNPRLWLRRPVLYPLSYGGTLLAGFISGRQLTIAGVK